MTEPPRRSRPRSGLRMGGGLRFTLIVAGAFLLFVPLAIGALLVREKTGFVVDADRSIEAAAHRAVLGSPALLTFARDATHAGDPLTRWIVTAAVLAVLAWRRAWRLVAFFASAVGGGLVLVQVVKAAVGRSRPVLAHPVAHAAGASFPSGHAMGSTIVYGAVLLLVAPLLAARVRWLLLGFAVLLVAAICASRVLLGVHYVSDVVAGFVFGLAWLAISVGAFEAWRHGRPSGVGDALRHGVEPTEQDELLERG